MVALPQYDYLFAFGTIFAFLDAWNIGANDVANSWATSVASRSVTYLQAMGLASICEFGGAFGVGARVADTIRTKIVDTSMYEETPGMLMLGMVCAVTASSIYLTLATKIGFPVSTTHSIMGGVIGMGVASVGAKNVIWVAEGTGTKVISSGVVQVFLAWVIAPVLSGCFASAIFMITKYAILLRSNPVMKALIAVPIYFAVAGMLVAMLLVWKGGSYEVNLTDAQIPGVTVAAGAAFGLLIAVFLCPWLYRVVIKEDWQLRWYHIAQGPLLLRRGEVPAPPADQQGPVRDYYQGRLTRDELEEKRGHTAAANGDIEDQTPKLQSDEQNEKGSKSDDSATIPVDVHATQHQPPQGVPEYKSIVGPKPDGSLFSGPVLFWWVKYALLHGVDKDVVGSQNEKNIVGGDLEEMHTHSTRFDNKAEYLYTFLQIMTACAASFTHGANDVANAIGPYATIYEVWNTGTIPEKSSVPLWILGFGAGALVLGIWTYGYNIMRNLGNRLTLQSPSRGFSIELGSVIAIIIATKFKLPVSTTQCLTGGIVGVGLCNGTWRALNWRMIGWIYLGWFITLPVTGIISGGMMGIIINAPRWGMAE